MSKKISRLEQYGAILERYNTRLEDCQVLCFRFDYPLRAEMFHYGLMAEKPQYFIFDIQEKCATVVVPADEENAAKIASIAERLNGKKVTPNLV